MRARVLAPVAAALAGGMLVAGCASAAPPPPPRPRVAIGPAWQGAVTYLRTHPHRAPAGMTIGVLVQASDPGYVCFGYCHTWQGIAVVAGGWAVNLSSDQGDAGMAPLVSVGDEIEFPAGNVPVDAPVDDGNYPPGQLIERAVVAVPEGS